MPIRCLALDRTPARNESNSAIGFQIVVVSRTFESSWCPEVPAGAPGVKPRAAAARGGLRGERQRAWCRLPLANRSAIH